MKQAVVHVTREMAVLISCTCSNLDCASPSVITVTISNTETITETLAYAIPSSSVVALSSTATASSKEGVSTTLTIYSTYTTFVSIALPVTTSSTIDQGPYYFSVHDGSTVWLGGKTPPVTDSYIKTVTTTVLVEPVPSSVSLSSSEELSITSTKTVILTSFLTKQPFTETVTETGSPAPTSLGALSGTGSYGWNSSTSISREISVGTTRSGKFTSGAYATRAAGFISIEKPLYSEPATVFSRRKIQKMKARQAGTFITATINGVVVSWPYPPPTTPAPSSASTIAASIPYGAPSAMSSSILTMIQSTISTPTISVASPESLCSDDVTTSAFTSLFPLVTTTTTLPAAAISFGPPSVKHSGFSTTLVESLVSATSTPTATYAGVSVAPYSNMSTTSTASASTTSSICAPAIINSGNFTINVCCRLPSCH